MEKHLGEMGEHARRIQERLGELEQGRNPVQAVIGLAETLIGQTVALSRTPFDLVRGTGGEEKVLKNAKDACASEALEIATYRPGAPCRQGRRRADSQARHVDP